MISLRKRFFNYLNPIAQLGNRKYSYLFPFLLTSATALFLELYFSVFRDSPEDVGMYAIFLFIALIIYFAFRDGIRGGFIASGVTIIYYGYIVYSRQHTGDQLRTEINTIAILGILYILMAGIIGWLKVTIDKLIEQEADEKRRLQAILQQLPVGVIIVDKKGVIIGANRHSEIILDTKIPVGHSIANESLIPTSANGKDIKPSEGPLSQTLTTGRAIVGKEYLFKRKDGREAHIQVSASIIRNRAGKVIAAAEIINDITQQKEMEKRKDDFVNMASHELKTPLTSMKLYIDSLVKRLQDGGDQKILYLVNNVKNQTDRLQELVNDLLDVSRLHTGKLSFTKERFDIVALVQEIVNDLQGTSQQNILFAKKDVISVFADRFRIYQVLTNLVTNAIKYSSGKGDITLKVKKQNGSVLVSVKDNGIGIAKEQQKKIFDRLYQVTDPKEKTFPGLGMGLYISKEIIKRHHGKIWVESERGKGSTFYFSLPVVHKK